MLTVQSRLYLDDHALVATVFKRDIAPENQRMSGAILSLTFCET